MVKSALWLCGEMGDKAVYLQYEIGWYYFLNMKWSSALEIFEKVAVKAIDSKFFHNQNDEIGHLIKLIKSKHSNFDINITKFNFYNNTEKLTHQQTCILPHITNLFIKIAGCYFQLGNVADGMKWLLSTIVVSKKYALYKNIIEEDFGKLAMKYVTRNSKFMLIFELFYFLRHLTKLPDDLLTSISSTIDQYLQGLDIDPIRFTDKKYFNSLNNDHLYDYYSGILIITINNCLLGETIATCKIWKTVDPILSMIKDDYMYIQQHLIYWFSRALVAENRNKEAKELLKRALKFKKTEFSIATRIKNFYNQLLK